MTMQPDTARQTGQTTGLFRTVPARFGTLRTNRVLLAIVLLALAAFPGAIGEVTRASLTDAYIQVSVFVAGTLMLFYGAERLFSFNIPALMQRYSAAQVPLASLFGAIPGCGGAVVVVAAFSSGHVGMGAVVATLTATMGDAAFLLLATQPEAAAIVLPLSLFVGIISGYVVDWLGIGKNTGAPRAMREIAPAIGAPRLRDYAYIALVVPGLCLGIAQIFQVDFAVYGRLPEVLALVGIALGMLIWSFSPIKAVTASSDAPVTRATEETSFITAWVILAYLAYEYLDQFAGLDLGALFNSVAPLLPLIAIVIGFVPGCGPQVLVTTLYINGVIPFAALIGNAISNDGDALFPAIAINPKAAVLATWISAIPAVIVAYGFYFLLPDPLVLFH